MEERLEMPSKIYFIKVEQIDGHKWASNGDISIQAAKRFLSRKRKEYGNCRIVSFYRTSEEFCTGLK
jgi:membrane protease subunit (stomatin/prohibitin family)